MKSMGVGKALRPALVELARRSTQKLGHPTYVKDRCRNVQRDALVVNLEKARGSNPERRIACYETQRVLKTVSL